MLFGAVEKTSGKILFKGKEIHPRSPRQAIDAGYCARPRRSKAPRCSAQSIGQEQHQHGHLQPDFQVLSHQFRKELETANLYKTNLLIKTPSVNQLVRNLSGGNQQKVILGKWLAANSELIIFDEPTRGMTSVPSLKSIR